MSDKKREPMTGVGGGTGLMELTVSADALTDESFAAEQPGLEKSASSQSAMVLSGPRAAAVETKPPTLIMTIHNLLRRKYKWLIPLALAVGVVCGYAGYRSKKPVYTASGLVKLKANLPRILYPTEQSSVMPMFDAFAESQMTLLTSERVLDLAARDASLQNTKWAEATRGASAATLAKLQKNLKVARVGSELIKVSLDSEDPDVAMLGVKAILEAYVKIYGETDAAGENQRSQVLEERRDAWTKELKQLNDRKLAIANEFGTDTLEPIYQFKLAELNKIETELRACQTMLALEESKAKAAEGKGIDRKGPTVTVAMLADTDAKMRAYLNQKLDVERRLSELQGRLGSNHNSVLQLRLQIETLDTAIAGYLKQVQKEVDAGRLTIGTPAGPLLSVPQLRQRERDLQTIYAKAHQETVELGRKDLEIKNLKAELLVVQDHLNQTKTRLEQLTVESMAGGRISVFGTSERPSSPSSDKRIERAGLGGVGGIFMVFGAVIVYGLMDRRINTLTDFKRGPQQNLPMLGLLPQLPNDLADLEQSKSAAYCVHHIRTRLETDPHENRQVYSITSATSGDGKTSLVIALGLSFAGANSRTLMLDLDVVGGGLTRRMNSVIRRKIGQILVTQGLITDLQLDRALNQSKAEDRYLGEVLVELGFIQDTDVVHALSLQEKSRVGLMDALAGQPLHECVARTGTNNLWILPLGGAEPHHMGQLSPKAIRRVIADARKSFDVILIDTGTILGNLEASIAAAASDDVILAVGRGQDRSLLMRATSELREMGARVSGVVFNRADSLDVHDLENITTSQASQPKQDTEEYAEGSNGALMRMGPLANAVVAADSAPEFTPAAK